MGKRLLTNEKIDYLLKGIVSMQLKRKASRELKTMDVQKFLKIYSNEGIIFQPLTSELQEANVEQVYNIEEVTGVGQKVDNRWVVKEI